MASRRAQVSAPATVSWCSPWFLAVLVAFIGGISLGSLRSGGTALGWGAAGTAGTATAAAPMKRSKSAASAGLRPAGKGAGRRRRRAAIEESELEDGVAAVPAALPVKEKLGIVPPPPKPDGEPFSLSFYDGKSITVRISIIINRCFHHMSICSGRVSERGSVLPLSFLPSPRSRHLLFNAQTRRSTRTSTTARAATTGGTLYPVDGKWILCRPCASSMSRRRRLAVARSR